MPEGRIVTDPTTSRPIKDRSAAAVQRDQFSNWHTVRGLLRVAALGLVCAVASVSPISISPVMAQNWWPFGGNEPQRPPIPREPVYRNDAPPSAPIPPQAAPPAAAAAPSTSWATKNPICLQLEQRLVQEGQKGNQSRDLLPKIESEIRQVDRTYNVGATQLDRSCYEYFLFTKSFRATPQCRELVKQVESAKRRLAELEAQRQDIVSTGGRSYQDDIVRELARNNCGANYADQARRRDSGVWQDEESVGGGTWTPQNPTGVATYRTVCVRLCDGFYFPVSFSTLPSHFPQDADACSSKCAAPTELFYYPNPGGTVDQSVALTTQAPYTTLKTAFRYRKEYVNGCSCKESEYDQATATPDKKADAGGAAFSRETRNVSNRVESAPLDVQSTQPLITGTNPVRSPPASEDAAQGAPTETPAVDPSWQPQ